MTDNINLENNFLLHSQLPKLKIPPSLWLHVLLVTYKWSKNLFPCISTNMRSSKLPWMLLSSSSHPVWPNTLFPPCVETERSPGWPLSYREKQSKSRQILELPSILSILSILPVIKPKRFPAGNITCTEQGTIPFRVLPQFFSTTELLPFIVMAFSKRNSWTKPLWVLPKGGTLVQIKEAE